MSDTPKPLDLEAIAVDARDYPQFTLETHVPALVAEVKHLRSVVALTEKDFNRARAALLALKEALDP